MTEKDKQIQDQAMEIERLKAELESFRKLVESYEQFLETGVAETPESTLKLRRLKALADSLKR